MIPISIIYTLSTKRPNRYPYRKSIIFPIVTVYRLSTVTIYSRAYRLPIWIAYKIPYKHTLYFGIPSVLSDHLGVPYHLTSTHSFPLLTARDVFCSTCTFRSYLWCFSVIFRPYRHHRHINRTLNKAGSIHEVVDIIVALLSYPFSPPHFQPSPSSSYTPSPSPLYFLCLFMLYNIYSE